MVYHRVRNYSVTVKSIYWRVVGDYFMIDVVKFW
jgi:hypothetical protein